MFEWSKSLFLRFPPPKKNPLAKSSMPLKTLGIQRGFHTGQPVWDPDPKLLTKNLNVKVITMNSP